MKRHSVTMVAAVTGAAVCSVLLTAAGSAAAGRHLAADARAGGAGGTWGTAVEIPGTAALNLGGQAETFSVSCGAAGNCSAGGYYTDGSGHQQAFVASEKHGTWGTAQEVPGTAALNLGGSAQFSSVSCASPDNCSGGGYYTGTSGNLLAFVAGEKHGTWGKAEEVPGTVVLNKAGQALVSSVSCASAGNCSAAVAYTPASTGRYQAYVTGEKNSIWGTAQEVPGTAALNRGGDAQITSLSCASAGNCSAGGTYSVPTGGSDISQVFVAGETNGTWGKAEEVPGSAALNKDKFAEILSVSCASAANCSAGGYYTDGSGLMQAFVASQANGTWGKAQEVPGTAALNQGGLAVINSVSCASAAHCSAGGTYKDNSGHLQAFVVGQT